MAEPSLTPLAALGGPAPGSATHGTVTIAEDPNVAITSLAARRGGGDAAAAAIARLTGAPAPGPGRIDGKTGVETLWTGPGQWFLLAPYATHELLDREVKAAVGPAGSVTEQSDGWTCLRLSGAGTLALLERLCMLDLAAARAGFAARSILHHVGAFVICDRDDGTAWRLLTPRSSAVSLFAALEAVAEGLERKSAP